MRLAEKNVYFSKYQVELNSKDLGLTLEEVKKMHFEELTDLVKNITPIPEKVITLDECKSVAAKESLKEDCVFNVIFNEINGIIHFDDTEDKAFISCKKLDQMKFYKGNIYVDNTELMYI